MKNRRVLIGVLLGLTLGCGGQVPVCEGVCPEGTEDLASESERSLVKGASSTVTYEATLDYGRLIPPISPAATAYSRAYKIEPLLPKGDSTVKRAHLRIRTNLMPGGRAKDLAFGLQRGTLGERGGPGTETYSCVTSMSFDLGTVSAELVDDVTRASVVLDEQPLVAQVFFQSPANSSSRCTVHKYPSFDREGTVYVSDPADLAARVKFPKVANMVLSLPDGTKLEIGRYSVATLVRYRAVAEGDSYRVESVASGLSGTGRIFTPGVGWSLESPSGEILARGSAPLRNVSAVGHHLVRRTVETSSCDVDPENRTGAKRGFAGFTGVQWAP
jgi:hypothetical protein